MERCPACDGLGRSWQPVGYEEWTRYRRRRSLRGIVLLVGGLLPFVLLAYAIARSDIQTVCGTVWYGLIATLFLTGR